MDSAGTLGSKFSSKSLYLTPFPRYLHLCVLCRNPRQPLKMGGTDFCEMAPVDSADTLWVKNFVVIALSRTVSEILKIFHFQ